MSRRTIAVALLALGVFACSRVPITNRKQTNLMPEAEMIGMSATAYNDFLSQNQVITSTNQASMVKKVGEKIAAAATDFLTKAGKQNRVAGFNWQFNLVNDNSVNAWCMPGGMVVFYTGIMPICETEAGLAVVMGHEVAHAIARHGNERMSQGLMANFGFAVLGTAMGENPSLTKDIFMQSVGIGTQLGMLSFSRKHETEADKIGLVFMAMAGYDPQEAPKFWERMSSGGQEPPEFLSTHPSHETRIKDINAFMPEALKYYKPS